MGLHARPTGALVKEAAKCSSKVTIRKGEKTGDAKRIFNIMGLSIKANEEVEIIGADSLGYLRTEDLSVIVDGLPLCKACFDNQYPIIKSHPLQQ